MKRLMGVFIVLCLCTIATLAAEKNPVLTLKTTAGNIIVELYPDKAPITVKNFLTYVEAGFYNGTIFHRVIPGFMIQGGGFTSGLTQKKTLSPIKNEASNGLANRRGTLAMARTGIVDSATSQFFINVADNTFLNYKGSNPRDYGYAVFGTVLDGIDVVDTIVNVPTKSDGYYENVPVDDIIITSIEVLKPSQTPKNTSESVKVK